jgi:hypothetical protein
MAFAIQSELTMTGIRTGRLALAGLAALLLFPFGAHAQRRLLYPPLASPRYGAAPFVGGFSSWYWGYPLHPVSTYAQVLQGYAALTEAQGQYWNQIQQARLTREESRRSALDTQRQQVEFELWYESVRPTAPRLMKARQASELDWARNYARNTEIWSGRALNVLLRSILQAPRPTEGPHIPLSETTLRGLNLTDGRTRANLSMARNEGRISWPEALAAEPFDTIRDRFSKEFAAATHQALTSGPPPRDQVNRLRQDLQALEDKLNDQVSDLAPSRFIESRRLLNQLRNNVQGLAEPRVVQAYQIDWRNNIRTVSDLVAHLLKNGLQFGPTAPGDEASYSAAFLALRQYEDALSTSLSTSEAD